MDATYFRRWYGNFTHRRQPRGDGGRLHIVQHHGTRPIRACPTAAATPISGLYDVNPVTFGPDRQHHDLRQELGKQVQMWNGVAFTANARLGNGIILQGGIDMGTIDAGRLRHPHKGAGVFGRGSVLPAPVAAAGPASTLQLAGPLAWHCHTEQAADAARSCSVPIPFRRSSSR